VTHSNPPFIATWLLEYFLPETDNHPIAGDLIEAYRGGRSRIWYWREVLTAILLCISSETKRHPISALRAVSVGWLICLFCYRVVEPRLFYPIAVRLLGGNSGYPFSPAMLTWFALSLVVLMGSGYVVSRLHRDDQLMVFLFACSLFLFQLRGLPWIWRDAADSLTNARFVPYLVFSLECQFLWPLAVIVGGLYASYRRERHGRSLPPPAPGDLSRS
jgi:cytochrome c biogenesis factor